MHILDRVKSIGKCTRILKHLAERGQLQVVIISAAYGKKEMAPADATRDDL